MAAPLTTNQKALRNFGIFIALFIAAAAGKVWTDRHFHKRAPTATESAESWRQQKLEKARVQNYLDNIKPHVPAE